MSNSTKKTNSYSLKETILWWEKKRLIFNLLIIGFSAFLIYSFWDYPMRSIIGSGAIITKAVLLILFMNLCYTIGWGVELLAHLLIKSEPFNNSLKWFLFGLGTLMSLVLINFYFAMEFDVLFAGV